MGPRRRLTRGASLVGQSIHPLFWSPAGHDACRAIGHDVRVSEDSRKIPLYLVVRVDGPVTEMEPESLRDAITLIEAFPDAAEAATEVERLSRLNADKGAVYFSTSTRFYPEGRTVQAQL